MSHTAEAEVPELELVETETHSEEKFKKINHDILNLQADGNLVLGVHVPEITHKLNRLVGDLIIVREDGADTNRIARKMHYDDVPKIFSKIDELSLKLDRSNIKIENLFSKVDDLTTKVDGLTLKFDNLSTKVDNICNKLDKFLKNA